MTARKVPAPKLLSITAEELDRIKDKSYHDGVRDANTRLQGEREVLQRQREHLSVAQTDAVTKLIEACNANLSKAGYLIGKLNKDTSR